MDGEHVFIVNSKEYQELEKDNNRLRSFNIVFKILLIVCIIILYKLVLHCLEIKDENSFMSQQLDEYFQLKLDVQQSYQEGYYEGRSVTAENINQKIYRAKETSYASGYNDAIYDVQEQSDYVDGYVIGSEHGMSLAYDDAYQSGYEDGYASGLTSGYDDGFADGERSGYADGYADAK